MKASKVKSFMNNLVEVEWVDSAGVNGWHQAEEILANVHPALCVSYGRLVAVENKTAVIVATASENGNWNDAIMMPTQCITWVAVVEPA